MHDSCIMLNNVMISVQFLNNFQTHFLMEPMHIVLTESANAVGTMVMVKSEFVCIFWFLVSVFESWINTISIFATRQNNNSQFPQLMKHLMALNSQQNLTQNTVFLSLMETVSATYW